MQQINYLKDMKNKESHLQQKSIESDFSFCLSMYHAVERLERHGLRVFLSFFDINKEDKHDNKKYFLTRHTALMLCVNRIRNSIVPNPFEPGGISIPNAIIPEIPEGFDFGHPKYEKLRNHLLDHFNNYTDSKALVFCELRDSVYLIYQLLLQNEPLIKPKTFIGKFGLMFSFASDFNNCVYRSSYFERPKSYSKTADCNHDGISQRHYQRFDSHLCCRGRN